MRNIFRYFRFEEVLALSVFLLIMILSILGHKPLFENIQQSVLSYSYMYFLFLFVTIYSVVIIVNKKNHKDTKSWLKLIDILRDWLPVFVVIVVYESLKHLHLDDIVMYLGISQKDSLMLSIDNSLFGKTPSLWMESLISYPFTKINELAYDSYYFYLPILGIILYLKGKYKEFRVLSLTFILIAYSGYILYLLIPVAGPQFQNHVIYSTDLYIFGRNSVQQTIDLLRFDMDCFPSLHTAQPLAILILSYRYDRKIFYLFFFPVILTIFSTMYLRYHYGVDVIAGIILAIIAVKITPKIFKFFDSKYTSNDDIEIELSATHEIYNQKKLPIKR
ncbi:phosphatase PAP2 family protein [bacterium]|nr:phosphatase PAP2 family protein [bacterium]